MGASNKTDVANIRIEAARMGVTSRNGESPEIMTRKLR